MSASSNDAHTKTMQHALQLAHKSPPQPTNFRVGALLVKLSDGTISAEGYTLELPGNTHAEQCCLLKLAERYSTTEEKLPDFIKESHVLYTTIEPCSKRLSGSQPCVERVLRQKTWIKKVYVGVQEPDTFVKQNEGQRRLRDAGIEVIHVTGMEDEILAVAKAGHINSSGNRNTKK